YQLGVLRAVMRIRREAGLGSRGNPFSVICGTSAGAINAATLACHADDLEAAVQRLCEEWGQFHAEQVYRSDSIGMVRTGAQWLTMLSIGWVLARWRRARPRSLLDNAPLAGLLERAVPFQRLPTLLRRGTLRALAVTASSYTSGEHINFYQAEVPIEPWTRSQRVAVRTRLGIEHLMASSAIPFVFPAVELTCDGRREWFGDGSMRQTAPISPAIHLGAQRVLVIGAGRMHEPMGRLVANTGYPSIAQIAGHSLAGIFLDALAVDVERLERINRTLALLPPDARARTPLRPVEALVIAPSQRLDDLAARHQANLPAPVRALLRGAGVSGQGVEARGAALASYLLFEAPYTRELIALGEADAQARREDVIAFLSPARPAAPG
ncbi:MAG: patatin-like phospholipase family protein, partial [Rubrivivax sp.]